MCVGGNRFEHRTAISSAIRRSRSVTFLGFQMEQLTWSKCAPGTKNRIKERAWFGHTHICWIVRSYYVRVPKKVSIRFRSDAKRKQRVVYIMIKVFVSSYWIMLSRLLIEINPDVVLVWIMGIGIGDFRIGQHNKNQNLNISICKFIDHRS